MIAENLRKGGIVMANFNTISALIRVTDEDNKVVCSLSGVNPAVQPAIAAGFVSAIETLYNKGECTARLNITSDIARA